MAYASLVSLAQTIDKITLNHDNQYPISEHRRKQIISIHEKVILLQRFLDESAEKTNSFEGQITDVANEAEDIFEYFMLEQIQPHFRSSKWHIFPAKFRLNLQLRKIRNHIDRIIWKVMSLSKDHNPTQMQTVVRFRDSPAASSSSAAKNNNDIVVGLDDDLITMMSRLCGETSKLLVVPIVGMGGIGKTTLARNVYDNPLIMQYFDIRAWVTVSEDDIISGLLASLNLPNAEICRRSNESDEEKVYKSLKGRRYLIVMDDMWSTQAWEDIRNILPNDGNGSRIMLTTRLSDVAAFPNPSTPLCHEMCLLDEDQSWNLLQKKVFGYQECPWELQGMGKMIAVNCKGLPLAIVVVAGLLSTVSKTRASWEEVAKNISSAVATNNSQFEEILSLSYTHLPHHLRPCFLYMIGFREDHELRVSKLVKLWVAEGFMRCRNGYKSLEAEAEECLEDLIKRNLVFVRERKSNGKIKSCSLHDLMRDLFIRKSHQEKFLVNFSGGYIKKFHDAEDRKHQSRRKRKKYQRRICTEFPGLPYISQIYGSTIHTIMCFFNTVSVLDYLGNFRLLRVLDAGDAYVRSLPAQLFELFHLRYLALNYLDMIPAAISNLQNLQTFIILGRDRLKLLGLLINCLPQEVWRMPQLRHFIFRGRFPDPNGQASALENLQTLSLVSQYMCTERILKMMPNLRKLGIDCSDYQDDAMYLNNLVHLHQLETLELRSSCAVWRKDGFAFPKMLRKLSLSGLGLPWNEMTWVGSLPNLEVLKLRDHSCRGDRWETSEGEFQKLVFLSLDNSNLEHWITQSSHFPSLKFLVLHYCRRLSEIPYVVGEFPLLEVIEVDKWNKDLVKSVNIIQEEQRSFGNDFLQLRVGS